MTGIDEIVLSLTAKGLTTGEVAAHFADVYGATVSKDTISRITDKVVGEMAEWCNRPLKSVYPVVFIDAIFVKIRDGQVTNRALYVAVGVTCAGERDILGLWAGDGGEGAKFWLSVLTEIKNRGTGDVCILVCDGLKGLPEAVNTVWDRAIVQTCVIHLLRNTFRYASRKYWDSDRQRYPSGLHRCRPRLRQRNAWSNSPPHGAPSTRQSSGSGRTRGASSCPSWTTTWRYDGSSAPQTPWSRSTPANGARSGPADISPPNKRP